MPLTSRKPLLRLAVIAAGLMLLFPAPGTAQVDQLNFGMAIVSKLGTRCLEHGPDPEGQLFAMPCRWGTRQQFRFPIGYVPGDDKGTLGVDYFGDWRCALGMNGSRMPGDDAIVLTTCYTNWPSNVWRIQNGTIRLTWNNECLTIPDDAIHTDGSGKKVWKDGVIIPTVEPCTGADNQTWYRVLFADYADLRPQPMQNLAANVVETIVPYPVSAISGRKDGWGPILDGWWSREMTKPAFFVSLDLPAKLDAPKLIVSDDVSRPVHVAVDWADGAAAAYTDRSSCVAQPAGLAHWWGAEGAAHDMVGGRHGTPHGGLNLAPGKVGRAFALSGRDGYIELPGKFGGGAEMTIAAWAKSDGAGSDMQAIVSATGPAVAHLQLFSSGNIVAWTNGGELMFPISPEAPGEWHHYAMSLKSGDSRLYVDGRLAGSDATTFTGITSSDGLRIGSGWDSGRFFKGSIDEVQIFDRALSAAEVEAIHKADAGLCRN